MIEQDTVRLLRECDAGIKMGITSIDDVHTDASSFDRPTEALNDPFALLYQSGYLTIKNYDRFTDSYTLGIPNKEVRVGLMDNILPMLTQKGSTENSTLILKMYTAFSTGDMDGFFEELGVLLRNRQGYRFLPVPFLCSSEISP